MHTQFFNDRLSAQQGRVYEKLNALSFSSPMKAKLYSLPVAILDVTLETIKLPLRAIESIALAVINVLGFLLDENGYTMKDALVEAECGLCFAITTPIAIAFAPIKFLYQSCITFNNPQTAISFCPQFEHED